MKNKFEEWKQAVKNTPPERLMKINMQGFALQTLGLSLASILIMFSKTIPSWLVLAFCFGIFNTISGFISSYQQYSQLMEIKKEMGIKDIEKSPHRRKVKLIKKNFGLKAGYLSFIISLVIAYIIGEALKLSGTFEWIVISFIFFMVYYITYFYVYYYLSKLKTRRLNGEGLSKRQQ